MSEDAKTDNSDPFAESSRNRIAERLFDKLDAIKDMLSALQVQFAQLTDRTDANSKDIDLLKRQADENERRLEVIERASHLWKSIGMGATFILTVIAAAWGGIVAWLQGQHH